MTMYSKSLISTFLLYLCFDHVWMLIHRPHHLILFGDALSPYSFDKEWDFLMFTQQWPSSQCKVWTHNKPHHHCIFPKKQNSWTVHGIWPTKKGTKGPFNCNNTWLFDPEQVRPIESELEEAWTNVEKETQIYNLWAHEWNKHGTCAAMIEPFNSQLKYFSKGIDFLKQYHMNDMLQAANIIPSDTVAVKAEDINRVVVSNIGIRPMIQCESEDGVQYLIELRICFDKQLHLMECQGEHEVNGLLTNCNLSKGVIYPTQVQEPPPTPPKSYLVQLHKFVNWVQWFTL